MDALNERAGVELQTDFADSFNQPTVPVSVHWRLDCETTGNVLRDWTEITPTVETDESGLSKVYATIDIPGSLNAIQSNRNYREKKTLWVVAGKDTEREYSETYEYWIMNRRGRT
jgi:hypothetical protein